MKNNLRIGVQLKIEPLFLPPSPPLDQYFFSIILLSSPLSSPQHKPNNTYTHTTQLSYSHTTKASFLTQLAPRESESHANQTGRLFSHHNNNNSITATSTDGISDGKRSPDINKFKQLFKDRIKQLEPSSLLEQVNLPTHL